MSSGNLAPASPASLSARLPAERIASHGHGVETFGVDQFAQHEHRVVDEAGVIEPAREVLGAPAVALVQPHHVPAGRPRFVGHATHVVRLARSFEPVQQEERGSCRAAALPMTMREHAGVGRDVEIARFRCRQARKYAALDPGIERLTVAATEARLEWRGLEGHAKAGLISELIIPGWPNPSTWSCLDRWCVPGC